MSKIPTNKLAIYLIKNDYSDHKDIIKNIDELNTINISKIETFYYGNSFTFPPSWIKNFFGTALGADTNIFSASAKGLLLLEIVKDTEKRIFALAFGYG